MLQLNDDCLLHIFREFNFREQLMLTRTCVRFRAIIVNLLWRSRFREHCNSEYLNTLTGNEYQEFFALNSVNLEKLTIANTESWVYTSFYGHFFRPEPTFYFKFEFPCLLELDCQDINLFDEHVRLIAENCANLRVLRFSWCYVTGAYMKDLRNLRELYVSDCRLEMLHLEAIMRELPLTHLDVTGNNALNYHLGILLSKLPGTNLRELHLSGYSIDEEFIENYNKLHSLKMLKVTNVSDGKIIHWIHLLQAMGARTKAFHIEKTSSNTSTENVIARKLSLLCKLPKLYFAPQSNVDYGDGFRHIPTLKDLHVEHEKYLMASLPLISTFSLLEHIYLECHYPNEPANFNWAYRLVQLLQSQITSRPVLNVHILEHWPVEYAQADLLKELDDLDPQQSVVKWVLEPRSTFSMHEGRRFVIFEFE